MKATMKTPLIAFLVRYLGRLRFPYLVVITGTLFVVNLFVPDLIPFVDEILLGLVTVLLASRKKPREVGGPGATA